ncbi:MAG: hypothetical protein CVU71_03745 [Deltaproteobacteria bacterium HGW-Deltaproteobacteria-6]|jgi:hypothetical protein|nr:MAG: hypothetical protein CVU71_03745 [Deltaproteobacteria bacterium HGW-Deltaproteobacteria-6]
MNTDIRIQISFAGHVKRKKLQSRLKAEGVLALIDLWLYAGENHPDGSLNGMTNEDIGLAVNWKGNPDKLISTFLEIGFIEGSEGSYIIHDWEDNNPYAVHAPERKERAKVAAAARWGQTTRIPKACKQHATSMPDSQLSNAPSPSPSPNPSPNPAPEHENQTVDNSKKDASLKTEQPKEPEEEKPSQYVIDIRNCLDKLKIIYPGYGEYHIIEEFITQNTNRKNRDAIIHSLNSLIKNHANVKIIRFYLEKALEEENKNYNAAAEDRKSQEFKKDKHPMEAMGSIMAGMFKSMPAVSS